MLRLARSQRPRSTQITVLLATNLVWDTRIANGDAGAAVLTAGSRLSKLASPAQPYSHL
jgi:hypothetical protein